MRKLIFRVWDKLEKAWLDDDTFSITSTGKILFEDENKWTELPAKDFVVQNFVGLLDQKKRQIFEGDIIQYKGDCDLMYDKPGVVSFGEFRYDQFEYLHGVRVKRLDMKNAYFGICKHDTDFIIIGNVLENADFVKVYE